MGNQLSQALAEAGIVPKQLGIKQVAQETKVNLRKQHARQRERYLESDKGRPESYSSPADFMEHARQLLKEEGFSSDVMQRIIREAHQFADAKLSKKQRSRMHAFLCKLQEKFACLSVNKHDAALRDGKRAFREMNVKYL